ncbi:hypothetical protein G6F56_002620 [Rhizopus delemar]|nr:hypothetical protein G6F56_002620 [Rhizopus delemar]
MGFCTLTKAVRDLRTSLHGIGLSFIIKNSFLNPNESNVYLDRFKDPHIIDAFSISLENIRPVCIELTEMCFDATDQYLTRIKSLHYHARTDLNSLLWPFPRLWASKSAKKDTESSSPKITPTQIKNTIIRLDKVTKSTGNFKDFLDLRPSDLPRNGPLYLLYLYLYNLKEYANHIAYFLELVVDLERKRLKYRFWFPHQNLSKWIKSYDDLGGSVSDNMNEREYTNNDLTRCTTRNEDRRSSNEQYELHAMFDPKKKTKRKNPDVSAPKTRIQKAFCVLFRCSQWLLDTTTFFAFKTALGVVMLAIPAWRPEDHEWYLEWRGQWAMIILVLWMFPMTGAFIFGIGYRVFGSVLGAVLGIVVWEITRGNPYGLAVLLFFVFLPMYYIFFFVTKYRVAVLMGKVTMLLVIVYEYNYVNSGAVTYDQVYTVAGKRLLMVVIGIVASGILISIPFPPTSRVELRKKLANTIQDIGKAYGLISASVISLSNSQTTPAQKRGFQKLSLELRRQVAEERVLLCQANYEPPIQGYFPAKHYKNLVDVVDNLSDLIINMASSLGNLTPEWKKQIASALKNERKEYISSILTTLKLTSSTLSVKTSLPPYIVTPIECRERFTKLLENFMRSRSNWLQSWVDNDVSTRSFGTIFQHYPKVGFPRTSRCYYPQANMHHRRHNGKIIRPVLFFSLTPLIVDSGVTNFEYLGTKRIKLKTSATGFEPVRAEPIRFQV